jgi:hypothetical protein
LLSQSTCARAIRASAPRRSTGARPAWAPPHPAAAIAAWGGDGVDWIAGLPTTAAVSSLSTRCRTTLTSCPARRTLSPRAGGRRRMRLPSFAVRACAAGPAVTASPRDLDVLVVDRDPNNSTIARLSSSSKAGNLRLQDHDRGVLGLRQGTGSCLIVGSAARTPTLWWGALTASSETH